MKSLQWNVIAYWTMTAGFAAMMLLSSALYLSGAPAIQTAMLTLGYPVYLLTILGTAKMLGALALLQTRSSTLREWAYAGFAINMIGATASHVFAGDPAGTAVVPAAFLIPLGISYALRPDRTRGSARFPVAHANQIQDAVKAQ